MSRWPSTAGCCAVPALWLCAAALAAPPESIDVHGSRMAAACTAQGWAQARAALAKAAPEADLPALTNLLQTFLCADERRFKPLRQRHAPARLRVVDQGTGQATQRRRVPAAQALQAREGQVFGLQVHAVQPAGRLSLQWQSDEACVHGVGLALRAGRWMLVDVDSACD